MIKKYKIQPFLLLSFVFVVALSVSWGNLMVTYSGEGYTSKYEHFFVTNLEGRVFLDRGCGEAVDLKERHRLRWVSWVARTKIYDLANSVFGYKGVGGSYALLHALFVCIAFWFTLKISLILWSLVCKDKGDEILNIKGDFQAGFGWLILPIFLVFYLFTFNGLVSEYTFSVIEAAFVAAAIFFALEKRIFLFALSISLAVLHRESGFLLLFSWPLFNGFKLWRDGKNLWLLLPPIAFGVVNFDILHCLLTQDFLLSSKAQPGQLTYHIFFEGVSGIFRGIILLFFNYMAYIVPAFLSYRLILRKVGDNSAARNILIMLVLYFLMFLIATPLNHMSVKYIAVPILVPLVTVSIILLFSTRRDNAFGKQE